MTALSSLTDADVIALSLQEPERFAELFRRHFPTVQSFCLRRLEAGVADEVAAEVFTRAFTRRDRYDAAYLSARPWLFAICTDLIGRHRRSERRRLAAYARLDQADEPAPDPEAIDRADAQALMPATARALARLRPADRDLVVLIAWAGLSYEEAARALGVPLGTVRSRLSRTREQLARDIAEGRP